jgi:putative MATE family efflux protein
MDDSVVYMNILLIGVLPIAYFNILSGVLRSLGDSFSPLIYLIITCVLNVALNFLLIPEFGVHGAALGTVFAQAVSSVLCFRRIFKMRDVFDMGKSYLVPKKEYVMQILKLGVPSGASQVIIALSFMVVQPLVNSFGAMIIATNVIIMRIDSIVMMPIFSFGNAMTVFAGQNVGAGKMDRVNQGTRQGALMAMGTTLFMVTIIVLFGRFIAGAFTQTAEVIEMASSWLRILAIGFVPLSLCMVLWGTIRGAGDAISPMWGSIVNSIIVRIPVAFLLVHLIGEPIALIYSIIIAWISNTLISIFVFKLGKWRTKGIVKREERGELREES